MGALYVRYIASWKAESGGLMAIFSSVSRSSKWGSWGALEYYDQGADDSPKFRTIRKWLDRAGG